MPRRTDIYSKVWEAVRQIPRGKVTTYGEIARACGFPRHARLVGYALHNLPLGAGIPWHRVVNSEGKISLPRGNGSYQRQRFLLEKEGISFTRDRIDLSSCRWSKGRRRAR